MRLRWWLRRSDRIHDHAAIIWADVMSASVGVIELVHCAHRKAIREVSCTDCSTPLAHAPTSVAGKPELGLRIDMRSAGPYIALLQSKTVARKCELRGNTDGNRKKTLRCERYVLPVKIAVVNGMVKRAAGVQGEM